MNTRNQYERNAKVFKALCDSNRLMIIKMLQTGERCACEILEGLHIGQSTLSHHMKILIESGIVAGRPEGKWMYYSLSQEGCEAAKNLLDDLTRVKDNGNREEWDLGDLKVRVTMSSCEDARKMEGKN